MKSFIVGMSLLIASAAHAKEFKIYETYDEGEVVKLEFAINKNLGRAWVEVTQDDYSQEGQPTPVRVKVPGMSFDAATSTVFLTVDGKEVECANLYTWGRFIRRSRIDSNRCNLSYKRVTVNVDDGFEVRTQDRLQVFLTVE